jgi:hypothetical protein
MCHAFMTQRERSGEQSLRREPEQQDRGISIHATPAPDTGVIFQKAPDGGVTISFQGNITIDLPQAVADVAGAVGNAPPDTGYRLIADGTLLPNEVTPASRPEQRDEREVITHHITFAEAPESIIRASETPTNGLVPEHPPEPLSDQHSAPDMPSREASGPQQTDALHIPESENQKFEFVGNPVRNPAYWVRRSGKKVAEFHLATHPEPDKEKTLYYRIRAFDKQADRVRDTVRQGQTQVSVVAYGPKYWPVTRRTKDGQEKQEVVQGYYAGFVNVPKRYRQDQPPPASQQPLE